MIIKESSKQLHLVVVLRNRRMRTLQKEHEKKLMLEFTEEKMQQIKVSEKNRAMMIELLIRDEKLEQMMSVCCE